jgi:Transglutaminase-like superfamily/Domain of unknown function (DUF4129)
MTAAIQQQKQPRSWLLDGLVWLLLALLLTPTAVAMQSLAWARTIQPWVIPGVLAAGLGLGALIVLTSIPQRWWWVVFVASALFGAAMIGGALLAQRGARTADNATGDALFGAYTATLSASLPWLAFRTKQIWLGVALAWVTVAGAWTKNLSAQQVWWMLWLIVISLLLIGVVHLREETRLWQAFGLERLGPVLWPSARVILSISLLIAVTGLIPLGVTRFAALSAAFHRSPFAQGGGLDLNTANGTPVAVLGAPLSLAAPDVTSNQVILTYTVVNGPPVAPPLLGAAFDAFDGSTWSQGLGIATIVPQKPFAQPQGTQLLTATITLVNFPRFAGSTPLLGFDQPLSFSVSAQAQVIGNGAQEAPDLIHVAGWVSSAALAHNATYSTTAAVLPSDAVGSGVLPTDLLARMTATPASLQPVLSALAQRWAGSGTPAQQAQTLLDNMQSAFVLDPKTAPPAKDAVAWFLQNKRGNMLLWTTTYILLGRSIGLPLRLAEGYLSGSYDRATRQQLVRASDATVWAQLAIPHMGWLDLFPVAHALTISVPAKIIYTGKPTVPAGQRPTPQPSAAANQRSPSDSMGPLGGGGILLAILGALIVMLIALLLLGIASVRWNRFGHNLGPLTQFFARVAVLAKLAGIRLHVSDTATQATAKVVKHLPEHREALVSMNRAYERLRYGVPGDRGIVPNLREQWRALRGAMYRLVVTRPWRRQRDD